MSDNRTPRTLLLHSDVEPQSVRVLQGKLPGQRGAALRLDASDVVQIVGSRQHFPGADKASATDQLDLATYSPSTSLTDDLVITGLSDAFGVNTGATA
jgi:hypothetical protein